MPQAVVYAPVHKKTSVQPGVTNDYAALKKIIKDQGLLERQPVYSIIKMIVILLLLISSFVFLFTVHNFWWQLGNAAFLAIVCAQVGFLGHEAGHRQLFSATWKNELVGLIFGNLLLGMSASWWIDKHNRHHSHPNQVDLDPDIALPGISFSSEEARSRRGLQRFIMLHQAYCFFPMLLFVSVDMLRASVGHLLHTKMKYRLIEATLLIAHLVVSTAAIIYALGWWQGLVFIVLHQAILGFILGSAFAPNHKGMPVLEKESQLDFLRRQVLTARNIHSGFLTDFWYGGLNYQIEHHLFPTMARNRLHAAQHSIKTFCQEHEISYAETGVLDSYGEILHHLHEVSKEIQQEEFPPKR